MGNKELVLMQGEQIVKRYPLDKDNYSIGRSKDNDLVFDHVKVSRAHARLYSENGEYIIQDLNSTNYVFVNGVRVKQKKLSPGDRVQISSEILLLFQEREAPPKTDRSQTLMDVQQHFVPREDLLRLKKVTQSVVLLNSLDSILLQILKEGVSLTRAERGLITLTDSHGKMLWKYATTFRIDREKAELGEADVPHSILQEAISGRKTVVRFNEQNAQLAHPPSESMMSLKIFSAMCAPLVLNDRLIGVFYVDARELMNNFTEVDQFLFDYLADHAAIAIFNAKKFNDLQAEHQQLKADFKHLEASRSELEAHNQKLREQLGQQASEEALQQRVSPTANHTFSAGGVVLSPAGQLLVVNQGGSSWSLPKGHIEVGEEPAVTAMREIFEETGLKYLHLLKALGTYQRSGLNARGLADREVLKTISMYLFLSDTLTLAPQDPNNPEARWVSYDEACALLSHPKDQAFLKRIRPQLSPWLSDETQHSEVSST